MKLQQATRKQARMRLGLQGPSGSGKTFGALQVAFGICGDWKKIAVVDTEYNSASLYSHLGPFNTLNLQAPYSPEKYCDALHICEHAGMEVIIIDSVSHEWEGNGGILDIHGSMTGNSFTNWGKVTPRHNHFIQSILQSPCHIIVTVRSKQDYVLTDKNGKMVPEKVGLKGIQRDGVEYEFTTMFELDIKHNATASKDRTSLFAGKPEFKLTAAIGKMLLQWCNQGEVSNQDDDIIRMIYDVTTVDELLRLYKNHPSHQVTLHEHFTKRRKQLQVTEAAHDIIHEQKNYSNNGQHNIEQ
jgi:hypothetical protein